MKKKDEPQRELFVLGIARRQALSAYDIDRIMRDHVPLYRRFARGNAYAFVERLAERGFLLRRSVAARRGPKESKSVYRLSAAGEVRFKALLREVIEDVQSSDVALETAFVLLGQLPRAEALDMMQRRNANVEGQERRMSRFFGDVRRRGGSGYFSASHAVARLRAERKFLNEAIALLTDPAWEPGWILDDGPITDPSRKR